MESLFILIPLALFFCGVAIAAFFWAVDSHQFDDLDNAGRQILFDDDRPHAPPATDARPGASKNDHA
ncbi:MAG: cbb3-type cytochrome oxidase assembly protein CcoS [Spongiibacteraceae bacterium]